MGGRGGGSLKKGREQGGQPRDHHHDGRTLEARSKVLPHARTHACACAGGEPQTKACLIRTALMFLFSQIHGLLSEAGGGRRQNVPAIVIKGKFVQFFFFSWRPQIVTRLCVVPCCRWFVRGVLGVRWSVQQFGLFYLFLAPHLHTQSKGPRCGARLYVARR